MRLVPMYLGPGVRAIGLRYLRNAFPLLPVAQAELASQTSEFADSAAFGNGFDLLDVALYPEHRGAMLSGEGKYLPQVMTLKRQALRGRPGEDG